MELWIPITIAAAFLQNVRSAMQKHLKGVMGTTGATFVRFGFGVPFAVAFVAFLHLVVGYPLPRVNTAFLAWCGLGGIAQIEMLFTFASSVFVFRERINRMEIAGCALIVSGILTLLAFR